MSEQEENKFREIQSLGSKMAKEPFLRFVSEKIQNILTNPSNHIFEVGKGGLVDYCQKEVDALKASLEMFKRVKYPELIFDGREEDIEKLREDEEYNLNIQGVNYHSQDIENKEDFKELKNLCVKCYQIMKDRYNLE